ncbi:MAG: hypothetical protein RLZZ618_3952 [Pseudomonadota bacterium]
MPSLPAFSSAFYPTVSALALGQLFGWAALYYTFSSFVLPMNASFGWGKADMMGAFTLGLAMWGAGSYAAGAAIDRGHGRAVLTGGAALAGVGFLAWSQVSSLVALYAVWAVLGLSMSMCLYEPAFSVVTRRFPTRFGTAITGLTLVGGLASTLSYPAVAWLIATVGWRASLMVVGAVLLLVAAPLNAWALRGAEPPRLAAAPGVSQDATFHDALRHKAFWLLALTFTLYSLVSATFWAHVMPAFVSKGTPEKEALLVLMWIGPAQVLGRLAFLGGARHVATRVLGLVVFAALPAALLLFALAESLPVLLLFAVLFGAANGLVTIVRGHVVPMYFGRAHVGRISGAMSTLTLLPRAFGPLLGAWLLLVVSGYRDLLLTMAGLGVLALLTFASARPPAGR